MIISKAVIYYTDNILDDNLCKTVRSFIAASELPIYSASLKPIDFGDNEVINEERGYPSIVKQIISCLSRSREDYVFFCEHDVLYPKSHFEFTPTRDDIFYYNRNTWRWLLGSSRVIQHDRMHSLSTLCANRQFALDHYLRRQQMIEERGWDKIKSHEPGWARAIGYEPGTKKKKRGGFSDDDYDTWYSIEPVVDVRHKGTFSRPKTTLTEFKHPPKWFKERPVEMLEGWDLREMFHL